MITFTYTANTIHHIVLTSNTCPLSTSFTCFYLGESISSETSNGYLNEAEVTWQAFDEEADTQSTQSAHMDVTADPQSQGSLLLSHNEALAGIEHIKQILPLYFRFYYILQLTTICFEKI